MKKVELDNDSLKPKGFSYMSCVILLLLKKKKKEEGVHLLGKD